MNSCVGESIPVQEFMLQLAITVKTQKAAEFYQTKDCFQNSGKDFSFD